MLFLLLLLQISFTYEYVLNSFYLNRREFQNSDHLEKTFFAPLVSYQFNAVRVTEDKYPWIARVVHSKSIDLPHICTASCIHQGIFITAARSIFSLKVDYTTVIYQSERLPVRAIVIPSNGTKQAFDDIGFIVVEAVDIPWETVQLFREINRTDDNFKWLHKLSNSPYKVLGYAAEKGMHLIKSAYMRYDLTELNIVIEQDTCSKILTFNQLYEGFEVPCYHSCTVEEFYNKDTKCKNYHGVEGGAILHEKTNKLLGVATWGAYFGKYELPVGFSVVNSENFYRDYECAKMIWATDTASTGNYQNLCDNGK